MCTPDNFDCTTFFQNAQQKRVDDKCTHNGVIMVPAMPFLNAADCVRTLGQACLHQSHEITTT
jgi:hypothetical protein